MSTIGTRLEVRRHSFRVCGAAGLRHGCRWVLDLHLEAGPTFLRSNGWRRQPYSGPFRLAFETRPQHSNCLDAHLLRRRQTLRVGLAMHRSCVCLPRFSPDLVTGNSLSPFPVIGRPAIWRDPRDDCGLGQQRDIDDA
jgi:hypothetical protein